MSVPPDSLRDAVVLVTGGAGFLGVHVAQALARRQARLVLQDTAPKRRDLLAPVLATRRADFLVCELGRLDQATNLLAELPRVDYLVHLALTVPAALSAHPAEAEAQYLAANLEPMLALLERLPERLKGVCLASSVSVYGSPAQQPVDETHPALGQTPYARTKLAMEAALDDVGVRRSVPVSVLRFTTLYGPGELASPRAVPSFIRNLLAGQPPVIYGDGTDVTDYLYVQDAARAVRLALEHLEDAPGVYNIGTGQGWTTRAIAEKIQRQLRMALPPKHMPARGPRRHLVPEVGRAAARLRFQSETALEEGLAAEIADFRLHSPGGADMAAAEDAHGLLMRPSVQAATQ